MAKGATSTDNSRKRQPRKRKLTATEDHDTEAEVLKARPHSIAQHTLHNVPPLRAKLLEWFSDVRDVRGMPWRQSSLDAKPENQAQKAYEVWVSEIMLQQTQVATVIPYYNRWMEAFPTILDLAAADIDTVNSLWKGLGYYSRGARLLAGAQKVVQKYDSCLPADPKVLEREIPGIGRYSAGAICSIAYGICAPVLDGNVHRLLSRVLAIYASPKAKKTLDLLWSGAKDMVEGSDRPGDVNQALIELGSTICKVRDPACESCPLKDGCGAYREFKGFPSHMGDIEDLCDVCEPVLPGKSVTRFPMKAIKKKARIETDAVNIVEWRRNSERYFALVRRPEGGLLAGLYEFPSCENIDEDETDLLELPHSMLAQLIESPLPKTKPSKGMGEDINGVLRVTDICQIGDTGGSSPPPLNKRFLHQAKKRKTHDIITNSMVKWVPEDDVAGANIGTGVLNVWKKARLFWNSSA